MLYNKNDRKPQSTTRWINIFGGIAIASMLSACSNLAMDHSVCDLRVLSLQIPKQSEEATTGSVQAIDQLKKSQEKLKQILPSAVKQMSNQSDADSLRTDAEAISVNIDILANNQKNMNSIYDYSIAVSEVIPGMQAEYNLIVDQMARNNYHSTQVVIAKNQVFIAERILRSLSSTMNRPENSVSNLEDFDADLETFNIYLQAQLNGNPELGVERIKDKDLRESLEVIKRDMDEILIPGSINLRKISNQIFAVSNAVKDNQTKSNDIFSKLNTLE